MRIWIDAEHTACDPARHAEWALEIEIGVSPNASNLLVALHYVVEGVAGSTSTGYLDAAWTRTAGESSYWFARLPGLAAGDRVRYLVVARSRGDIRASGTFLSFIGPRLFVALLWHQHQPSYKDRLAGPKGNFRFPWVRLHALRDYYSMAALVREFPQLHLTINLTAVLLEQLEDYVERGYTDYALELTLKPTAALTAAERDYIINHFFIIDWHTGDTPSPRYAELLDKRRREEPFDDGDITDLRMWHDLAWFAPEFRRGEIALPGQSGRVSVQQFVRKERGFSEEEIKAMVEAQYKIMAAIAAIHRELQESGQVELTTSPYYHPILPLLHDSDLAIMDRPGCSLPQRFFFPEDAQLQVELAAEHHRRVFGRRPRGMWPAEGAVGHSILTHFEKAGVSWIASDQGVLKISGEWGFDVSRPDIMGRAWCAMAEGLRAGVSIFFRDTELSDDIGFNCQKMEPYEAARQFVAKLKGKYLPGAAEERIVSIILDGENAWGWYRDAGRPFLRALYEQLTADPEIRTVTFGEYLDGDAARGIPAHPPREQWRVDKLAHASWIDERGSAPGNDLGTWIGEPEENRAWDLLRAAREDLKRNGITKDSHPQAFAALLAAEGSDWFWWFGDTQECAHEVDFDELFRMHLSNAYKLSGLPAPQTLAQPIIARVVTWTMRRRPRKICAHERLRVHSPYPGSIRWRAADGVENVLELTARGSAMTDSRSYSVLLPRLDPSSGYIEFCFEEQAADRGSVPWHRVEIGDSSTAQEEAQGTRHGD